MQRLSYLYKLPYNYSTKDGIPKEHFSKELDLAQTIFGYANKDNALKGRIQFSHFQATSNILELQERKEVLGTPRASYYPMYIKQQGTKPFTTFMDNTFQLSGRKRYPIHKGSGVKKTEDTGNENVGTAFKPLKDGVIFQGKLRYHNLKKIEVGDISGNKRLPNFFMNLSNENVRILLKTYFEGDGGVGIKKDSKKNRFKISSTTKSKKLASDICLALYRFGILARCKKRWGRASENIL